VQRVRDSRSKIQVHRSKVVAILAIYRLAYVLEEWRHVLSKTSSRSDAKCLRAFHGRLSENPWGGERQSPPCVERVAMRRCIVLVLLLVSCMVRQRINAQTVPDLNADLDRALIRAPPARLTRPETMIPWIGCSRQTSSTGLCPAGSSSAGNIVVVSRVRWNRVHQHKRFLLLGPLAREARD